jgi:hypothetical protein
MKGHLMIIPTNGPVGRITEISGKQARDTAAMLQMMKDAIGGGYIEKVPGFDTIMVDKVKHRCVALCDEDGKRKAMPMNPVATELWDDALKRRGHPGLTPLIPGIGMELQPGLVDYLVGPVAVLYGDREFLGAL